MEATKLSDSRDIYSIAYDNSTGEGTVTATFTNQADGDKSAYKGSDDGEFIVTVAKGWSGTDDVSVVHDNGETLDEGEVSFG